MKYPTYKLGDILSYEQPTNYIVESTEYDGSYPTPVLTAGKSFILGYTNETKGVYDKLPVIIFDDFTTASQFVDFKFKVKSSAMKILSCNEEIADIKYMYYLMQITHIQSDTHKRYWISDYSKVPVSLPPLPTQHAIVTRIETLFAELDKAVQHLRTAQQQLKTYRQAVLNHWLNNDEGKWEMVKLKDICLSISDGDHLPPKRTTQGIPFITISDIKGNCIDYSDVSYMTEEYYESLSDNRKAQIGDILYTVTGSFGIPVMVEDDKKFCFQRHIGLVRPNPNLAAQKWLYYMMQSPIIYSQANEKATGTAQKTVTLTVLRDFNLPLPPLTEQQRIVNEIESRLSQATASETYIENALQQAEALRQSILKKAFSGELVSTSSTTTNGG